MEQSMNMENTLYNLHPPSPPGDLYTTRQASESIDIKPYFQPGQFLYIKDHPTREMIHNAWLAIQQTETADFVRQNIESFQLSDDPRIWIITKKMVELGYNGHTGFSFGWTMRQMQFLYKFGENEFRKKMAIK